ncbi:MAG: LysR family transcriptional regulator [Actinobacteria bacterium]|nr:LysR family transcriptional regulator [Actinomycetota bacterium]
MNLKHLRTFCMVAESASLTAAAQRLGLTQSAVSLQLQKLEAELGAVLVDRTRHPPVLTAAGEALLAEGRQVLGAVAIAEEAVQRAGSTVAGSLRLSASTVPGEYLLPSLLTAFLAEHAAVDVVLRVVDTGAVYEELLRGEAAFGFVGARRDDVSLEHEAFAEDEIVLVAAPGVCPDELTLDALGDYPLLNREVGSGTQASVVEQLRAAGFAPAKPAARLTLGSTQAVMGAVREGAGLGFVSWFAAKPQIDCGVLQCVRLPGLRLTRTLWLVYERGRATGALRSAFLEAVRRHALRGGPPAI